MTTLSKFIDKDTNDVSYIYHDGTAARSITKSVYYRKLRKFKAAGIIPSKGVTIMDSYKQTHYTSVGDI